MILDTPESRHVSERGDRCDGATDVLPHHQSNIHVCTVVKLRGITIFNAANVHKCAIHGSFIGFEGICKALPVMMRASQVRYLLESGESVRGISEWLVIAVLMVSTNFINDHD